MNLLKWLRQTFEVRPSQSSLKKYFIILLPLKVLVKCEIFKNIHNKFPCTKSLHSTFTETVYA